MNHLQIRTVLHAMRNGAAGFLGELRHARRAGRQAPFNYRTLVLDKAQLRYVDLSGQALVIVLDDIDKVEFVREAAVFDDLSGPYRETKWSIHVRDGSTVEIMDEEVDRAKVLGAFRRVLPAFQEAAAAMGLASEAEGTWVCFNGRGGSGLD